MCEHHDNEAAVEELGPNVISMPTYNLGRLDKEMAKINKKAVKAGLAPLSYKVLREFSVVHPDYVDPDGRWKEKIDRLPKIPMTEVEIIGDGVKIEGWKFLGTFDHVTLPGSVIVNAVPGETIPTQFHNVEPICDHCGKKRIRNETFLLQEEESGDYKLIGRQCIRDFIGYDARQVFNFLKAIRRLKDDVDEDEFWGGGYGGQWQSVCDADEVLRATAAIIHKYGWVSKSKAGYDQTPTSGEVTYYFFPPKSGTEEYRQWQKWVAELDINDPRWVEEAKNARAWLKEQDDNNEYMHNLKVIDGNPENLCPVKLFGYWCSLVSSYQRAMETLREQEKLLRVNEHVGKLKERRNFNVNVRSVRAYESYYGTSYKHVFLDDEGHTLIWWQAASRISKRVRNIPSRLPSKSTTSTKIGRRLLSPGYQK